MRCYENELKNPIKNALFGQLARTLLVQVQKLKVDTEGALLQLDQILRANELNMAFIAAIPALILGVGIFYGIASFLNRKGPDPTKSTIPCRLIVNLNALYN